MKESYIKCLQSLMDFEAYVVQADFLQMFGEDKGLALWQDFRNKCASNTTIFYRILDLQERAQFVKFLLKPRWEQERPHDKE